MTTRKTKTKTKVKPKAKTARKGRVKAAKKQQA